VYLGILLWTIVCLAISVHFEGILVASDLTHFVPFAIFVSVASLLVIVSLLGCTLLKQRNPITTRIELASLGLLGVLWLALGVFLAISESAEADVECFAADSTESDPIEFPGFSTETYHAQYRVLEAFSLFTVILVWAFLLFLLVLALRQHRLGYFRVWMHAVPTYPWFNSKPAKNSRNYGLPMPVTQKDSMRRKGSGGSRRQTDNAEKPGYTKSMFWVWVDKPKEEKEVKEVKKPAPAHTRPRPTATQSTPLMTERRREPPRRMTSSRSQPQVTTKTTLRTPLKAPLKTPLKPPPKAPAKPPPKK